MSRAQTRTGLLAICAAAALARLWLGAHVVDDAYITFRYAERIAAGLGFTYNDTQHVLGTTTPLLTLLLALAAVVRVAPAPAALAISLASDVCSIVLGAAMLQRAGWPRAAWLFGVLVAGRPMFLAYSVSGLETSLYVMLLLAALSLLDGDRPVRLGLALAALVLCRLDGVIMTAICAFTIRRRPTAWRTYLVAAAAISPWILFSLWYFHSIVPASVQAKAHIRSSLGTAGRVFGQVFLAGAYLPLSALSLAGMMAIASRGSQALRTGLLWWWAYASVFLVAGAFGPFPWYFVPLLPLYFMGIAIAVENGLMRVVAPPLRRAAFVSVVSVAVAVLAWRVSRHRATIEAWGEREQAYRYVAEHILDRPDCGVAATEIGTIGYFYRGRILDLVGLVSPESVGRSITASIDAAEPCWIVSYSDQLGDARIPARYEVRYHRAFNASRTLLAFERR